MKRNQVLGVVIDAIFAKTSEFDDTDMLYVYFKDK